MKIFLRISLLANALLTLVCVVLIVRLNNTDVQPYNNEVVKKPVEEVHVIIKRNPLDSFAMQAPFVTAAERSYPNPPSNEVVTLLKNKKDRGEKDHLGLLVEYGLRVHWKYLKHTGLARELPVESNLMLSELVRLAQIPKYTNAHQAGWLNSQFHGRFNKTGWSSYQIYIWVKEHITDILSDDQHFPNWKRICELMEIIDNSPLNGVGGSGVCHYGCV